MLNTHISTATTTTIRNKTAALIVCEGLRASYSGQRADQPLRNMNIWYMMALFSRTHLTRLGATGSRGKLSISWVLLDVNFCLGCYLEKFNLSGERASVNLHRKSVIETRGLQTAVETRQGTFQFCNLILREMPFIY